jgi:indole-3-glycerol phosphate synthase
MTNALSKIIFDKRAYVEKLKNDKPFHIVHAEAEQASAPRGFLTALRSKVRAEEFGLITEIKKASPSAGVIRPEFSPKDLANDYEAGGAACLSVVTDTPYFQGTDQHLIDARAACTLPVLRKDFLVDVWQVAESRALGADCILIILAAVADSLALDLHDAAVNYGMDIILEVHNRMELDRALMLPVGLIGINNRNLNTFRVDLRTTEDLMPLIPPDRLVVSESGLVTSEDLARMQKVGVNCFLIGESLLRQPDVKMATLGLRVG